MKNVLKIGTLFVLLGSFGTSFAQPVQEKPLEFDLYGMKVRPRVRALSEKIPPLEKNQVTLDPSAARKNVLVLSNHWREGAVEFDAGVKLNRRKQLHFEMKW